MLTARLLGSPSFTILDYEGVKLGAFIESGTSLLHPGAVPASRFVERGFPPERLHSFPGLKEDIAFSGLDLEQGRKGALPPPRDPSLAAVLIRPPSQTSHCRANQSMRTLERVLDRLTIEDRLQVVFSPREESRVEIDDSLT